MNLQEANRRAVQMDSDLSIHLSEPPQGGSLNFARVMGSVGESFYLGESVGADEEETTTSEVGRSSALEK